MSWVGVARVVWRISAVNFRARLEYRTEFVLTVLYGVVWQASVLVFAAVLVNRFPGLGGWTQGGVVLIAAMRLLSHGLYVAVFGNLFTVPMIVAEGRIDGFLLRPLPVYRQVLLNAFNLNAVGDLGVAVLLFGVALPRLDLVWTPPRVAYLLVALVGGMLLEAAVQTVIAAVALRFPGAGAWNSWVDEMFGTFGNYPLSILPGAAKAALTFVLPVAFVAYFPAAVLTGRSGELGVPPWLAQGAPVVGLAAFVAAKRLWAYSLGHYQSAGG